MPINFIPNDPVAIGEIPLRVISPRPDRPGNRARFDIATGAVVRWANFPPGIQLLNAVRGEKALQTFPVAVRDGKVEVTA